MEEGVDRVGRYGNGMDFLGEDTVTLDGVCCGMDGGGCRFTVEV